MNWLRGVTAKQGPWEEKLCNDVCCSLVAVEGTKLVRDRSGNCHIVSSSDEGCVRVEAATSRQVDDWNKKNDTLCDKMNLLLEFLDDRLAAVEQSIGLFGGELIYGTLELERRSTSIQILDLFCQLEEKNDAERHQVEHLTPCLSGIFHALQHYGDPIREAGRISHFKVHVHESLSTSACDEVRVQQVSRETLVKYLDEMDGIVSHVTRDENGESLLRMLIKSVPHLMTKTVSISLSLFATLLRVPARRGVFVRKLYKLWELESKCLDRFHFFDQKHWWQRMGVEMSKTRRVTTYLLKNPDLIGVIVAGLKHSTVASWSHRLLQYLARTSLHELVINEFINQRLVVMEVHLYSRFHRRKLKHGAYFMTREMISTVADEAIPLAAVKDILPEPSLDGSSHLLGSLLATDTLIQQLVNTISDSSSVADVAKSATTLQELLLSDHWATDKYMHEKGNQFVQLCVHSIEGKLHAPSGLILLNVLSLVLVSELALELLSGRSNLPVSSNSALMQTLQGFVLQSTEKMSQQSRDCSSVKPGKAFVEQTNSQLFRSSCFSLVSIMTIVVSAQERRREWSSNFSSLRHQLCDNKSTAQMLSLDHQWRCAGVRASEINRLFDLMKSLQH